jgi:putative FmdB family regulatory protein
MPTYVYGPKGDAQRDCDVCCGQFEVVQKMSDDALSKCPKCGAEIERIICAPNLNGAGRFKAPSESSLARAGFTQYKKKGKGYYEKSFGAGPSSLNP